jgi:2-dehydropantoate 2-reductase
MKHAILGAGAIGGLVGAVLTHEGEDVRLLVRPENQSGYPGKLKLNTPDGPMESPVRIETNLIDNVDVLWIAVKTYQLIEALRAVPSESNVGTVIPLLNGIDHVDLLRVRFGHEYVVPATIAVEAERVAAGQIVQRSPFARLALSMLGRERLAKVADRLWHGGFTCEFQANEKTMLWSKLAFLAPFALTGTVSDMDKQGIFADSEWRARLESAVGEACAVAVADGAAVDRGKIMATLASLPATMRSSMQKDVSAGRVPELDAIGGAILRRGQRYNLSVPVTREMVARIQDRLSALHSASAS